MKIGEAKQAYNFQLREYNEKKVELSKQKEELEEKMKRDSGNRAIYEEEAAVLELTINAVDEKYEEYQSYMEKILEQENAIMNLEAGRQQGEAMEEYARDLGKILEVARRIMKGGKVPPTDEKKLMEYSMEMYQAAKNIGAMTKLKEKREYESLWEDEEKKENEDPADIASESETFVNGPEIVSVEDTVAGVESMPACADL